MNFNSHQLVLTILIFNVIIIVLAFFKFILWLKKREATALQLASIIESSEDGIFSKTFDGIITSWNKGAEKLYGYSATEAIGQPVSIIVPQNKHNEVQRLIQKVKEGKTIEHFETVRKQKNGTLIPVACTVSPIKNNLGKIIGVSVIAHNIINLKQSEERFRRTLEAAPDAMMMINQKGKIIFVNHQTETIFGYKKKELLDQPVEILIPERYRRRHKNHRVNYFSNPHIRPMGIGMELYGLCSNGIEFPVEISLSPLETEDGIIALASVRDITDRKQQEERFRRILEATPDAMVMINQEGKIVLVNTQTEAVFGYKKQELLGQMVEILIPVRYHEHHPQYRVNYFKNPHVRPMGSGMELFGQRKNGEEFPVEISLSPLETKEGMLALAAVRDITERKKIDELKNEFISVVSHELRTPLTAIQGSLSLLVAGVKDQLHPKSQQLLTIAKQNSERLIRLINDILDIKKIESGKLNFAYTSIQLISLLEEAVAMCQAYGKDFNVKIKLVKPIPKVIIQVDKDRIIQVLLNLLSNAIKFSPPKKTVKLEAKKKNEYIRISITDEGPGIPKEFESKVFEKFAQVDSSTSRLHGGTGLGLNISKTIIESHGGKIAFTTQKNEYTTFYFDLPIKVKGVL